MAQAIPRVMKLDPAACRAHVAANFDRMLIAQRYLALFEQLVLGEDDVFLGAFPLFQSLVHVDDVITDLHHTVHVVRINYRGNVVIFRDLCN